MRSILSRPFAAAALAAILAMAPPALAGEGSPAEQAPQDPAPDPEARRLFAEGLRHFNAGDYKAAIESFRAAYHRSPVPGLLYNLAQAHRLRGDCPQALVLYRRYLASNATGKNRQRTEARISEMETCVQTASKPPPDRAEEASQALPQEPPGPPPIDRVAAAQAPAPFVAAPVAAPAPRQNRRLTYALVAGGTAVGLGAVSGYFAWRAGRAAHDTSVENLREPWSMDAARLEAGGIRDERIAVATAVAALVAAGVATWLWLRD